MTYRQLLTGNADFRRLWAGQVVSEVGDWLNNIAVLALTIQLAAEGQVGLAIALYALARHLPLFLFGPIAGVVVDRADRRRVMIWADVARAVLALGFLLADALESLTVIYAVGASLFAVAAFFNAAKRAALPNVVSGTGELLTANSLTASTTAATIAVGSALGGVVATFAGRDVVFVLNALTFLASALLIRRIRARTKGRWAGESPLVVASGEMLANEGVGADVQGGGDVGETGAKAGAGRRYASIFGFPSLAFGVMRRVAGDFREGLGYVRGERTLFAIFVVAAGWGLGNGAARALYSIFGAQLGEDVARGLVERPTDFGISVLFVAMGVGGVLGAPLARRFNQATGEGLGSRMGRSMTLDGLGLTLFSFVPNLWGAALVLVAREVNFAIWWTAQQTVMMKRTRDELAGRVFASYETLTTLTMVGSMLLSGAAADRAGIRPVAACGGLVITLSGLLWFVMRRRRAAEAQGGR